MDEAEECIQEALTLARETRVTRYQCIALDETGNLALARNNGEAALAAFAEMHRLCPEGDAEVEAMSNYGMARAFELLGQKAQARAFGEVALDLVQQNKGMQHGQRVQLWYEDFIKSMAEQPRSSDDAPSTAEYKA